MRPIPVPDPELFEQSARIALANSGWYARLGYVPHFPLSEAQALNLLVTGGEYDIDADRLDDLAGRGVVSAPADGLWGAGDVVQAGAVLEARRQWQPTPSLHDSKKTRGLLALETARVSESLPECVAGDPRLDARHLLILMAEADNRELREKLLPCLMATIEHDHGVQL